MNRQLETKAIRSGVEVKDPDQGIVQAVVGRVGVKDLENDLFLPGSFGDRSVRVSAYNHRSWPQRGGLPPVGRGTIKEQGSDVVAEIQFFMSTQDGREAFAQVKEMGDLQEWSFGWLPGTEKLGTVTKEQKAAGVRRAFKSVPVVEVSPVLVGASIETHTVAAKCDRCAGAVNPAEVAAAKALMEGTRNLGRLRDSIRPPPELESHASWVLKAGHAVLGYPGEPDPPALSWFASDTHGVGVLGRGSKDARAVQLSASLDPDQVTRIVLHELWHAVNGAGEEAAEQFAYRWQKAVAAAHRWLNGETWPLFVADGAPPFVGHREYQRRGAVVLSRADARAYAYIPANMGSPWSALS